MFLNFVQIIDCRYMLGTGTSIFVQSKDKNNIAIRFEYCHFTSVLCKDVLT